jgi:BlaI family penicillinase repressor
METHLMARKSEAHLSRRERQIMDIIYRRGEASAAEVMNDMANPPGYSAVRTFLRLLEEKGHVKHRKQGAKYIFEATRSRRQAGRSAVKRVLQTFFDGSTEKVVAALLDVSASNLSDEELDRLAGLIEEAKKEGR